MLIMQLFANFLKHVTNYIYHASHLSPLSFFIADRRPVTVAETQSYDNVCESILVFKYVLNLNIVLVESIMFNLFVFVNYFRINLDTIVVNYRVLLNDTKITFYIKYTTLCLIASYSLD